MCAPGAIGGFGYERVQAGNGDGPGDAILEERGRRQGNDAGLLICDKEPLFVQSRLNRQPIEQMLHIE